MSEKADATADSTPTTSMTTTRVFEAEVIDPRKSAAIGGDVIEASVTSSKPAEPAAFATEGEVVDPSTTSASAPSATSDTATAPTSGPRDIFSRGEKLADDVDEVSGKVAPFAPVIANRGHHVADTIRATAQQGRVIAGAVASVGGAVKDLADTLEKKGVPVRKGVEKVWQTSPLPAMGRKG